MWMLNSFKQLYVRKVAFVHYFEIHAKGFLKLGVDLIYCV